MVPPLHVPCLHGEEKRKFVNYAKRTRVETEECKHWPKFKTFYIKKQKALVKDRSILL